jgi:hypothetical protein
MPLTPSSRGKTVQNRLTEMFKADLVIKLEMRGNTQVYRAADLFAY